VESESSSTILHPTLYVRPVNAHSSSRKCVTIYQEKKRLLGIH